MNRGIPEVADRRDACIYEVGPGEIDSLGELMWRSSLILPRVRPLHNDGSGPSLVFTLFKIMTAAMFATYGAGASNRITHIYVK